MPGADSGFRTAVTSLVGGFAITAVLNSLAKSYPQIWPWVVLYNVVAIILTIASFGNMNYWSLPYTIGWLSGVALFGAYLLDGWEMALYIGVAGLFTIVKVLRKF